MQQITIAYDNQQWSQVVKLSSEISASSSHFLEASQLGAVALYHTGKLADALSLLENIVDTEHNSPNLYLNFANFLALSGELDRAVVYIKKALVINPELSAAHNNLGSILFDLGCLDEALLHLHQAIAINRNYWEAYSLIGNVYFKKQQPHRAVEFYQQALSLNPEDYSVLNNTALTFLKLGNLTSAAKTFQKALKIEPQAAEVFIPLSAILDAQGEHQKSWKLLSDGIKTTPYYLTNPELVDKTTIVTFSGLQNSRYDLDNANNVKLNGGHFYTRYLIGDADFIRYRYHIMDNNIAINNSMPKCDLYLNTISDPDLESESLKSLEKYLLDNNNNNNNNNNNIINHPSKVMLTTRDQNYLRLKDIEGLIFPKTLRLNISADNSDLNFIEKEFNYPLLMRKVGTQTGTSFVKIDNTTELSLRLKQFADNEVYLIQYIDSGFSSLTESNLFRRFRFFFIDKKVYPVTCHIHNSWNVHSIDRSQIMQQHPQLTSLEQQFLNHPQQTIGESNYNILKSLPEIIELDFFGVDFSLGADNQLIIFEVNAAMNHSFNYVDSYPYLIPFLGNISSAFKKMLEQRAKRLKTNKF